jgi:starvation-inducible outer membrane lipoprotein
MKPILLFTTLAILLSGCMFSQPDDAGRTVTISS